MDFYHNCSIIVDVSLYNIVCLKNDYFVSYCLNGISYLIYKNTNKIVTQHWLFPSYLKYLFFI